MQITGEQLKQAMIAANITRVDHHDCGICGYMTAYVRQGELLYFDPGCDCSFRGALEPRPWEWAARWVNEQDAEWQIKLAAAFGLQIAAESAQ